MAKDKKRDNERVDKNNMLLILGGLGCAGLLLVFCVASTGIGYWVYSKRDPAKDGVAKNKDKDAKADADKDGKKSATSKLRKDYDKIKIGDPIKTIESMMGGRGDIGMNFVPFATDKKVGSTIAKEMRRLNVNVIRSWNDLETGETLVIGLQEDVVGFKGLYYNVGNEIKVDYVFTTTKK